jgi:hypothetical protein
MLLAGFGAGLIYCRAYWAEEAFRAGYAKASQNLKLRFEKVLKENSMFYAEDLGVVFVPKGGDTFEVVIPGEIERARKP